MEPNSPSPGRLRVLLLDNFDGGDAPELVRELCAREAYIQIANQRVAVKYERYAEFPLPPHVAASTFPVRAKYIFNQFDFAIGLLLQDSRAAVFNGVLWTLIGFWVGRRADGLNWPPDLRIFAEEPLQPPSNLGGFTCPGLDLGNPPETVFAQIEEEIASAVNDWPDSTPPRVSSSAVARVKQQLPAFGSWSPEWFQQAGYRGCTYPNDLVLVFLQHLTATLSAGVTNRRWLETLTKLEPLMTTCAHIASERRSGTVTRCASKLPNQVDALLLAVLELGVDQEDPRARIQSWLERAGRGPASAGRSADLILEGRTLSERSRTSNDGTSTEEITDWACEVVEQIPESLEQLNLHIANLLHDPVAKLNRHFGESAPPLVPSRLLRSARSAVEDLEP